MIARFCGIGPEKSGAHESRERFDTFWDWRGRIKNVWNALNVTEVDRWSSWDFFFICLLKGLLYKRSHGVIQHVDVLWWRE